LGIEGKHVKIIDVLRQRIRAAARLAKPSLIPAAIAGIVVFTGGTIYEQQNRENFQNDLKIDLCQQHRCAPGDDA
jgi:hypothetical protein